MTQHPSRLAALTTLSALMTLMPITAGAQAQSYPSKPVRLLVGFAPGGGVDISARIVAQKLGELWGQTVVPDNRAGAGGTIATDIAARAPADGYSLLFCGIWSHGVAPSLYKKLNYDHYKDFAPVSMIGTTPNVLVVNPSVPAKSVSEFIAYTKTNSGKIVIASPGTGSSPHMTMELFRLTTGINIVHVPYKGTALVYPEMFSGSIQILFDVPVVALPFIKQGRVRALGVSGKKRINVLPDVPTIVEAGIPGYDADLWFGLFAPNKVPAERLTRVHAEVLKALSSNEVRERFAALGADGVGTTPAAFTAFLKAENEKWAKVVKASGAKID